MRLAPPPLLLLLGAPAAVRLPQALLQRLQRRQPTLALLPGDGLLRAMLPGGLPHCWAARGTAGTARQGGRQELWRYLGACATPSLLPAAGALAWSRCPPPRYPCLPAPAEATWSCDSLAVLMAVLVLGCSLSVSAFSRCTQHMVCSVTGRWLQHQYACKTLCTIMHGCWLHRGV